MFLVHALPRGQTAAVSRIGIVHAVVREGGTSVRVAWWHSVLSQAGYETRDLPALSPGRSIRARGGDHLGAVIRGAAVPETLAWSGRRLTGLISDADVDALVVVTLRAFDARGLPVNMPILVDLVDRLSASYRQRATADRRLARRGGWRLLGYSHARTESWVRGHGRWPLVAAGRADAAALGATWLPITLGEAAFGGADGGSDGSDFDDEADRADRGDRSGRRWDVLFTGTLDYPPNVAAVRALAHEIMPVVREARPGATLCVAGRRPTSEVRYLVGSIGADLVDGFDDYHRVAAPARVAVAPLVHATGLQIKVLDAARSRRPQVVTPAVASGFDPGFPLRVAPLGPPFAAEIIRLLDDPAEADVLASAAWGHARRCYSTEHWVGEVRDLIDLMLTGHGR
jgi:hypothetical protein